MKYIRKSRLIPRQERQVFEMSEKMDKRFDEISHIKRQNKSEWSIERNYMVGLTRRERELKKILFIALEQLKNTENKEEIVYWLSEWEGTNVLLEEKEITIEEAWSRLYEQIVQGWSMRHETFSSQIVRSNKILEKYWEKEYLTNKNKENQKYEN